MSTTEKKDNHFSVTTEDNETNVEQIEHLAEKVGVRHDGLAPVGDLEHVIDKIDGLSVEDCKKIIADLLEEHKYDYNFGTTQREKLQTILLGPAEGQSEDDWLLILKSETVINKFYSPYPEVRAITAPSDDPNTACETIRAHLLGYIWAVVAQFINSLFNSRWPQVIVNASVAQVLLYPSGKLLALILPDWGVIIRGQRVSLNPGPWTYKEQVLSTIICNVSITSAYTFWNIQTQEVYYKDTWLTPAYKIMLLLSTQLMGLGFAGLLRRFAIYPTFAIWPNILPTLALNRALLRPEKKESLNGWTISRYKFFFIVFGGMFVYFWLPGYLFPALSFFSWLTWIAPNNFNLAVVTGSQFGLGFNPITSFDWNVMNQLWYPLQWPFFSFSQQYLGTLLGGFVVLGLYYTNTRWTAYLPPNANGIYDNTGSPYNQTRVVANGTLNEAAYEAYSPAFQSAGKLVAYGAFFVYYPLTMAFVLLDTWQPIWKACCQTGRAAYLQTTHAISSFGKACSSLVKGRLRDCGSHLRAMTEDMSCVYDGFDDPFTALMRNYAEVPDWWFLVVVLISFIFAIIILTVYKQLSTPVWTIFFAIGINLVFLIPMTFIQAISGAIEGLNVIAELIVGYALPGHPESLMFVKAYGYMINGQADTFLSDQKMGLYASIPPRAMFRGQVIATILTSFVAFGVVQFADNSIEGICTPTQAQSFTCKGGSLTFFTASLIFGAIGPQRLFDQLYPELKWCFLLGFLLALVWWAGKRVGARIRAQLRAWLPTAVFAPLNIAVLTPLSWLEGVHPSLVVNGAISWAPQNLSYYTPGLYVSFAFMYYLRRYKTAWWERYNYVLAAGLSAGVAFGAVIIFFAVQYHPVNLDWWGTNILNVGVDGGDGRSALIEQLPAKGFFGPDKWS